VIKASTFTSYINAELPSNVDQVWRRYEQIATKSYDNIARAAEKASRAGSGLVGGRGTGGTGIGNTAGLARQAASMRAIEQVNRKVEASTRTVSRGFDRQRTSMKQADAQSRRLASGLSAVSTSLNVVQGPLGPLAGRVSALSTALTELTGFRLGLAGVASSLFVIGSVGNQYSQLTSRLRGAYDTQEDVNRAMNNIAGIASRARGELAAVGETYVKISQAADQLNVSQERAAKLAETVIKSAVLSGGERTSQGAAIYQFGQALASDRLGGEELRSVLENANVLGQMIAKGAREIEGFETTTIGSLREIAAEGKLTGEVVVQALENSAREVDARFERMPKTLGQGLTEVGNSFTLMIGRFDEAIGLTSRLGQLFGSLASVMDVLAAGAVGVGVGFASIKLAGFAQGLQASIARSVELNKQMRSMAQNRVAESKAQVAFTQRAIAGMNAQQAELREEIALLERRRRAAESDTRRTRSDPTANSAQIKAALREQVAAQQALNNANRQGVATADSLAAAERRLEVAKTRLSRATRVAEGRMGIFRTALRNAWSAVNPLGIAIGIATSAIIAMASQTSAAERTLESFSAETVDAAKKAIGLAGANHQLAQSYYEIARAMGRKAVAEAKEKAGENREEYAGRIRQVAFMAGPGGDRDALLKWADAVEKGTANVGKLNSELQKFAKRRPELFKGPLDLGLFKVGPDTTRSGFDNSAIAYQLTNDALREALEDQQEIEKEIQEAQRRNAEERANPQAPVSAASLRTQAAADALDSGTSAIKAAGVRRKEALRQLNEELGVANGKVPGAKAEEYRTRVAEIERAYNAEVEGARAAAKARTASARERAAAARQEIRDNKELAQSRLAAGLLDLEQRKPQLTQAAFYAERIKLLETYDAEIEATDAAAVNTSKAVAQMIRDTREMQKLAEKQGETRRGILDEYLDQPKALTKAAQQIDKLWGMVDSLIENTDGELVIYSAEQAAEDQRRILEGVRQPLRDAADEAERFAEVSSLRLQGYDIVADALERALSIQDRMGALSQDEFETLVDQAMEQERINGLLADRQALMEPILSSVQRTKELTEQFLMDLPEKGPAAGKEFFKGLSNQVRQIYARRITETLFAGAEQKLKDLVGGQKTGVDAAYEFLAKHAKDTGSEFETLSTDSRTTAEAIRELGAAALGAAGDIQGGNDQSGNSAFNKAFDEVFGTANGGSGAGAELDENGNPVIVVSGSRTKKSSVPQRTTTPNADVGFKAIGEAVGENLDKALGTTFFKGIGKSFGDALEGAGVGMAASGAVGGLLGIQQSSTGAGIGGAIGSFLPIPGGQIIGGLIGGTIGGLLKKKKYGTALLTGPDGVSVAGNDGDYRKTAGGLGDSVLSQLAQIADAVGGTVGSFRTSIGQYKGNYRVSTTGYAGNKLNFKGSSAIGLQDFGEDAEAAIAAAVADAVGDGAIMGISQASQRILRSGKDLQKAIEKVVAIESIPKRLLAKTDPVRYAVQELNSEFSKLISYLKEGGATAEQFAEAAQLYDLERADAIESATQNAVSAISDFMESMTSSSSSPLNKRTVYENAQDTLQELAAEVNSGKVVDQNKLVSAAQNFQDASRNLNGSNQSFFSDFDMLYELLGKARDNATAGGTDAAGNSTLPASPFETDSTVKALLDQYKGVGNSIDNQTDILADLLGQIRDGLTGGGAGQGSSIGALPGFSINEGARGGMIQERNVF
jgi:tape measure domain-containing protein